LGEVLGGREALQTGTGKGGSFWTKNGGVGAEIHVSGKPEVR